ncbi:MAG: Protein translocase subunit SecF [Candidatus Daviesbacteria bacterium GW2011_GWA2_40_9]|uniref:Protein-export membrane protein SecF n=1 Tax=Candidatus Daviesbacteria bacterium GW2011_GWA2_40_9 TaxID=1618424 RepID=A0A0G0U379_9BACT|nr:MAG: Protein translocase subunit SecF [Candidatus Daviesbacteria bacterium GW2011_GWA2_40_9]
MGKKWWFFILSTLIIIPGVISLFLYGLKLGIDFTGGTLLEYRFEKPLNKDELRQKISQGEIEVSSVIESGPGSYIIKAKHAKEEKILAVKENLGKDFGKVEIMRVESVGPTIGGETTKNAFIAVALAAVMIVIYLAIAFYKVPKPASSWRFGITAVVALLHDVLVVVGLFSILGHFLGVEVDVLFVTALLTVIGFSVHDTIVVFDRIRENLPKHLSKNFSQVANISITQTLARSLNTSLTVIFVLLATLLFGGESIKWFVVALLVGIISGTYSSIFNATALLALWEERLGH